MKQSSTCYSVFCFTCFLLCMSPMPEQEHVLNNIQQQCLTENHVGFCLTLRFCWKTKSNGYVGLWFDVCNSHIFMMKKRLGVCGWFVAKGEKDPVIVLMKLWINLLTVIMCIQMFQLCCNIQIGLCWWIQGYWYSFCGITIWGLEQFFSWHDWYSFKLNIGLLQWYMWIITIANVDSECITWLQK